MSNNDVFDVGIVGSGLSGGMAAFKIAKDHPKLKTILFDLGRPNGKRRQPGTGFFGFAQISNGQLFINDISKLTNICGKTRTSKAFKWFNSQAKDIFDFTIIKDNTPSKRLSNKIKKLGYKITTNNYMNISIKEIHALSKYVSDQITDSSNITCSFDNEIFNIVKHKGLFHIESDFGEFVCRKLLLTPGRAGWRFANDIFQSFGIIEENDISKFGIRIEMDAAHLKDFNESQCEIYDDEIELGKFAWSGTVVPEDHLDFAISAFRNNEERWRSDKVSFDLIGNRYFENRGFEQIDRLGQLAFILSNERVIREKTSSIMTKKNKLAILPEFNFLQDAVKSVSKFIPEVIDHSNFYYPTLIPMTSKINIDGNLGTEVPGMFVAGESCGIVGMLAAIISGIVAGDALAKK